MSEKRAVLHDNETASMKYPGKRNSFDLWNPEAWIKQWLEDRGFDCDRPMYRFRDDMHCADVFVQPDQVDDRSPHAMRFFKPIVSTPKRSRTKKFVDSLGKPSVMDGK